MKSIGKFFFVIFVLLLAWIGTNTLAYGIISAFYPLDQDPDAMHLVTAAALVVGVILTVIYFRRRRARLSQA